MNEKLIAGLDIGSSEIRLVVGQRVDTDAGQKIQIIGAVAMPSEGVSKGIINSIEDTTASISAVLEKTERLLGAPISNVWVGINGPNLKCQSSRGVVAVSRSDSEINQEDVQRVIEAAQALAVPPNYEILHVIPSKFIVDSQEDIKNPVGMTGIRLEVVALIIQNLSSQIKNLTKAIYHTGLSIDDLVFSPLAASNVVVTSKQKELGVAIVNIGSATTSLAVFEEGELLHAAVLPIGSAHITSDIAIGLRCPINLAEKIKVRYGSARSDQFSKKDEIDISDLVQEENLTDEITVISQRYVSEIIEARVEEIFEKIDAELKKIDRSGMLPAGVCLIGGGSKLSDIVEVAKKKLRLPASVGTNRTVATVVDKVNDLEYLTALGLISWGEQLTKFQPSGNFLSKLPLQKTMDKIRNIFSALKP
ncbi:MAG: cell division protein FtsA [Candidatus Falkowbacteria bacterium]|nr:cell division protein FtsA [Candidatus Falkowbacteria bacterium]